MDKISLFFKTVLESEARSILLTVQLDFSWTLEMSHRENDRFAKQSNSLSSSLSATRDHPKAPSKPIISNELISKKEILKENQLHFQ